MTLAEKYDRAYDESMPPALGRDILRLLAKNFDETPDFVEATWQAPEAHDLHGDVLRGFIEQDLRSVAARTANVIATAEKTDEGRSHYTLIRAGKLVITASRVQSAFAMPRLAEFRRQNSEERQLSFLERRAVVVVTGDVYGILLYGGFRRSLLFANIAFPDRSCTAWLHRIDLRHKYPDTWDELFPQSRGPVRPRPSLLDQGQRA
jgi:hypothetical protein